MENPWKNISLSDYEGHMSLDNVMQLETLSTIMKRQFTGYDVSTAMVLGVAGGNGLEHISKEKYTTVYGVDVNNAYLDEVKKRYDHLGNVLRCICTDLTTEYKALPAAQLIIADLLIEYIGYECFKNVVQQVKPQYVSCVIQVNTDDSFVSDSPYLHSFDGLDSVHSTIEKDKLISSMAEISFYHIYDDEEFPLPNGKKLVLIDFVK